MLPLWTLSALAAAVLVVAAAGCGGSQADRGDAGTATPVAASSPTAVTTGAAASTATETRPAATAPVASASSATPPPTDVAAAAEPAPAGRTPTPEREAGAERGPETGRPESRTGKPEKTPADAAGTTRDVKESGASGASAEQEYTWYDGDRVRRITLESGLVVQPSSQNTPDDVVTRDDGRHSIVERRARHATSDTQPVFRSMGGELMTLPGGVLLVLDDAWDRSRVDRFFSDNGIAGSAVERQGWAVNAFLIRTKPGLPSLDLANRLAVLEGVEISSPNWQTDVSTR